MTEQDFLEELQAGLRVGPLAKRRILLEISDHLEQAAGPPHPRTLRRRAPAVELLGPPGALAAEFSRTYAEHRRAAMRRASLVLGLGVGAMLAACAVILAGDFDGDRNFSPELWLVIATVAILGAALYSQRSRVLATCLAVATIAWMAWSLHLLTSVAGLACLALLLIGIAAATASERFARSVMQRVG